MPGGAQHIFLDMPAVIASPAMARTMESAQRVARTSAAVLITGETGTGKEIVARAVHHYSLRCHRPWIDVNCGALPEHLIESELFGHEKGAFSGADTAKAGLFEMANGGTLFLDEVGELEARMQVRLLRVLDGVPYYRLGGQKKVAVDVRIVAATNQDLERRIAEGRFRSDLYHRLNQFRIRVPALRERPEDILALAEFFLRQYSDNATFSPAAREVLLQYSWPGNIRDLRNAVSQAVISAKSYEIGPADLPVLGEPAAGRNCEPETGGMRLAGLERQAILDALGTTGGQRQKAAEMLGISRRTLSRKLRLYRSDPGQSLWTN